MKNNKLRFVILIISILSLLHTTVLPQSQKSLNGAIQDISNFITSDYYLQLQSSSSHIDLVDAIYLRGVEYYEGDYSEALLALTFATLPFDKMPLQIPFLNIKIIIPLPSPGDSLFLKKKLNLPKKLFFDTSNSEEGDKDKLPHFFGSAFLSYSIRLFNISKFMGIFVELFEDTFEVQGRVDFRDLLIDNLGELFGKILRENKKILPSQIMSLYSLLYFNFYHR